MVEATGFEPTTFWSRTKRATKLRYASIFRLSRFIAALFLLRYYIIFWAFSQLFFALFYYFFDLKPLL